MTLAAIALVALISSFSPTHAQPWPAKPVKIVVAFGPGGSADQFGRLLGSELSAIYKQQFYVENRPGNSGSIGSAAVARAEPDGYTLLIGGSGPHITGPAINPNIGYDPLKDFTHIAMIGADSYVLVANPALGVKNLDELVKLAHSRKDAITSSSTGPGSLGQLILEQFKRKAGIDILHVPAPNSGVIDVLGNHISMTITTFLTVGEQIRAGKVVPLGATSLERNPAFREIPTFAEQGYPDVHGDTWFWLAGPKSLPADIVDKLNGDVRNILKTPKIREYFAHRALLSMDVDVAGLNKFLAAEVGVLGSFGQECRTESAINRERRSWTPSRPRTEPCNT
jgi:tripartite-type tricarboxylate transporter receptor subunit TctC